jgi:preprotein translocase subunit SecY
LSKANAAATGLGGLGKYTELRQRLTFVILALIVYRIGCYIPVPGVDPVKLLQLMNSQKGTIMDMFNMFSGGALHKFSLFALNVVPYISASIVVQLMGQIYAPWKAMRNEGETGRRKLTQYSRYGAVFLAVIQSFMLARGLQASIAYDQGPGFLVTAVVALTTGTMFLMWLGEQITERGVGNGVSLIIFAGIVAGLPAATWGTLQQVQSGNMPLPVLFTIIALVFGVTYFVVFMERGLRKITVNYARRQGGRQGYMNQSSHLPLKLNMSGVIPPIFASSLILFPATISSWLATSGSTAEGWRGSLFRVLQTIAQSLAPAQPLHMLLYGAMIIGFAFFYTALVFNSQETAENLKKSGALIPGIRPGKATGEYIDGVLTRLTLVGALYLVLVCLTPEVLRGWLNVSFSFGGTSLLIVVVVVMDFTAQINAHLMSHQYEGLMRKANLKGGTRGGLARG